MRKIYFCDRSACLGPSCFERKSADRWVRESWVARDLATQRAKRTGRRQQVRRANVGYGSGWIVQEIR